MPRPPRKQQDGRPFIPCSRSQNIARAPDFMSLPRSRWEAIRNGRPLTTDDRTKLGCGMPFRAQALRSSPILHKLPPAPAPRPPPPSSFRSLPSHPAVESPEMMSISTSRVDLPAEAGLNSSSFLATEAKEKPFLTNADGLFCASTTCDTRRHGREECAAAAVRASSFRLYNGSL